jgi:hypothetical protein
VLPPLGCSWLDFLSHEVGWIWELLLKKKRDIKDRHRMTIAYFNKYVNKKSILMPPNVLILGK